MTGEAPVEHRRRRSEDGTPFGRGRITARFASASCERVLRGAAVIVAVAIVFGSGSVAAAPVALTLSVSDVSRVSPVVDAGDTRSAAAASGAPVRTPSRVRPEIVRPEIVRPEIVRLEIVRAESVGASALIDRPASVAIEPDRAQRIPEPGDPDDAARPLERPVVVMYGDSLAWEARHAFTDALAGRPDVEVVVRTFGGTAICDWFDDMTHDAAALAPGMIVLEFSGNSFTPCMHDSSGHPLAGGAIVDRYAADVERVIAMFSEIGTRIVLAGAPVSLAEAGLVTPSASGMNPLYRRAAQAHIGVRYVDAGASVLDDDRWTSTLPCLAGEPCTGGVDATGVGINVVRAGDGLHFCPSSADAERGVTGDCPVWASGAFRYGTALAAPVVESLDAH
ncbi:MAG: hypothetical protein QNM02_17025 [Acidimicrobiia bacterium]|nr:hypothetical protein [Acidimicrobiia bacterium]